MFWLQKTLFPFAVSVYQNSSSFVVLALYHSLLSLVCPLFALGLTFMKMKKPSNSIRSSTKTQFEESEEDEEQEELIESSSEEEDSEDAIDSDEEEEIERELAEVTFGELQKARADGTDSVSRNPHLENKHRRANKNRPVELSISKKPLKSFRQVIQAPKRVVRDPRFESLCGKLDVDGFRKRYNFLFENNLPAEREEVQKRLKKAKDPNAISELKNHISWIDKQVKFESAKHTDAEILAAHKKKEREAAKQGKRPFYLKKSEIRKQRLIEKYKKLKASGKLESFIEKRRRKNAAKDHRFMPYRRPNTGEQQS